jgi:hypothetical protein
MNSLNFSCDYLNWLCRPTAGATRVWMGVDSAWEQKKLEASSLPWRTVQGKMLENHAFGKRLKVQDIALALT